jgi:hypothetical protein
MRELCSQQQSMTHLGQIKLRQNEAVENLSSKGKYWLAKGWNHCPPTEEVDEGPKEN